MKRRSIKRLTMLLAVMIAVIVSAPAAEAEEAVISDIFQDQLEASGADELSDELPQQVEEQLESIGISPGTGAEITVSKLLNSISGMINGASGEIMASFVTLIGLIILSAMLERMAESAPSAPLRRTVSAVTAAGACVLTSLPAAEFIDASADAVKVCCEFDAVFIPVWSVIAAASGRTAVAAEYSTVMMAVLESASLLTGHVILPLLRVVLAVALTSSLSPSLRLSGAVKLFEKYLKWLLGFLAIMAVAVMGISTTAASAIDGITAKAAKFVISSSVPVVGGAMGEALASVTGCVSLLRTSVGAFGMVAMAFILLPSLIKAAVWSLCMGLCSTVSDMLGVTVIRQLAESVQSVISVMTAVIIFAGVLTIFTLGVMTGTG